MILSRLAIKWRPHFQVLMLEDILAEFIHATAPTFRKHQFHKYGEFFFN